MPSRPPVYRPPGSKPREQQERARKAEHDKRRGTSTERGYGWRWRKERTRFLAQHPLCSYCEAAGRVKAAEVVDHITPHKGDERLFWDRSNWQAMCKPCHDRTKQREERSGGRDHIAPDGLPADPSDPWRR